MNDTPAPVAVHDQRPERERSTYKKGHIPEASRRGLALRYGADPTSDAERFDAACERCQSPGIIFWPFLYPSGRRGAWVAFSDLTIDHIHPEFHGGSHDPENLQLLCRSCNSSKGAKV